jgi:UDP-2-acetamido-3-amino-2,3-dideoxy-glucuronate N-acetyltransferase
MGYTTDDSAIIDAGCTIGDGTKIWHFCHVIAGAVIGNGCSLGQNVMIGGKVILGNNVKVQNNVSIYDGVVCEDDVFIGPSAVFTNVINPRSTVIRKHEYKRTTVKKGSTIGANATIICGNTIGEYAFIGAGSVVTKDVLPYALITGNPGTQTGWISAFGRKLLFDDKGFAICSESGEKYILQDGAVSKS